MGSTSRSTTNSPIDHRQILTQLKQGELLMVNPRRKNGLILRKAYHGDFAGPGAIIGGVFDQDVESVIAVGALSLLVPAPGTEREKAYLIRRQWVRLLKQITDKPVPEQRAQVILNQFENWFDLDTAAQLSDDVFAELVGVLPQTIAKVRNRVNRSEI
ncbi:hypothetical protein AWQ21_07840 [Picosynechococcus sp. PCC 7003]|uniref:hypothetical protein n=1 Tax=Picosynechococcus sp. PCC 7003 TaxID=374981 RepID=UPI0008109D83|nr:hypothetical protein [Picosynechococcus sp. PCC 7003]ANV84299.1 hypothetical protein AWQ21_07840 [Picosynechococcus sp. PCC 7003]